jgi:uncharacterized protein YpuA (DUF1002 family)
MVKELKSAGKTTEKKLERALDVIGNIIENQPINGKIEIEVILDKIANGRSVQIRGDKTYTLASSEYNTTRLFVDGEMVRDDIESISKRIFSQIESFIYQNLNSFKTARQCKDIITGKTVFILERK